VKASLLGSLLPIRRRDVGRMLAGALAALLVTGFVQVPALAARPYRPPATQPVPAVPVVAVAARPAEATVARLAKLKAAPVWPAVGSTVLNVTSPDATATAAGIAVRAAAPTRVRLEVLDRAATAAAGVRGVLYRVARADGAATVGNVSFTVGYAGFATAYGGDWAARLRLVSLPECALAKPAAKQCAGTPLRSTNDLKSKTVSGAVSMSASGGLVALTAADSSAAGDYKATTLQPSSTWSAGGNSGAFNWNYPMRVPPSVGGPAPSLSLGYSSQSVDGRNAASNNQPSWMGEGFELNPGGLIERRYRSCGQDMGGSANNTVKTSDQCWETENATLSLGNHSGELLYNATEQRWHLRSDDGSRIEHKTAAVNGDNDGEYWVVTTTDGTQYWFGVNRLPGWASGDPVTNSTLTVPVFGNEPGEPCHATAFADSDCTQAWRWNLDYVIDVHGNTMSYWYTKETNHYGRNLDAQDAALYDREAYVDHISYGTRRDNGVESALDGPAPAQVVFGVADRCLSACGTHDEVHWPDTPWDQDILEHEASVHCDHSGTQRSVLARCGAVDVHPRVPGSG
jgi:hypothetical protein